MKYDPKKHHRRSIRLQEFDYTSPGWYFVTICTDHRDCVFGDVVDGEMKLNDAGLMVERVWCELPDHYQGVDIDEHVVMPNHFHGIIVLTDSIWAGLRACPDGSVPQQGDSGDPHGVAKANTGQPQGVVPTRLSLPDVVHRFKTMTTTKYISGVKQHNWPQFPRKLWQRNYFERVVRNERELQRIREYIINNPLKWAEDRENPERN
jgi:REP element-mobilizing transposase RayT